MSKDYAPIEQDPEALREALALSAALASLPEARGRAFNELLLDPEIFRKLLHGSLGRVEPGEVGDPPRLPGTRGEDAPGIARSALELRDAFEQAVSLGTAETRRRTAETALAVALLAGDEARIPFAPGTTSESAAVLLRASWQQVNALSLDDAERSRVAAPLMEWIRRGTEAATDMQRRHGDAVWIAVRNPRAYDGDNPEAFVRLLLELRATMADVQEESEAQLASVLSRENREILRGRARVPRLIVSLGGATSRRGS